MRGLVGGILTVDWQAFEQRQKRQTLIPRGLTACIDDIVAFQGADGQEVDFCFKADLLCQFAVGLGNGLIFGFVKVEQVEFVYGDDDVGAAQKFQNRTVAFGLGQEDRFAA